jgi:MYXO-CTERM domain-containing protein
MTRRAPRFTSALALAALALSGRANAAQTTIAISTAMPPAAPRVQAPFVVGAIPSTPFLYAIPATGQAPLSYSASGLPAGLALAASTGLITGTAPAAGSYPVTITVMNGSGSSNASLTILSGNMLRPTPPLGWNSYDSFGASIKESEVVAQAQALKTSLQPFGWNQVVIDYRWYDPEGALDANGRYLPSHSKYPSATGSTGFKALSDQIHALGLSFGIHIMRGIPRTAVSANTPIAGSTYHAADAGNTNDPCPWDTHMWGVRGDTAAGQAWYDALFQQYADWGIDFVKIDDMLNNTTRVYHQAEADAIRKAVNKTGRAILVSFSPGPDDPTWLPNSVANLNTNADMWRVVDDFWDYNAITDLPGVFRAAGAWQAASGLVQGHWPDADMLPLGYLGPRCEWHATGETTLTRNEQVTILSLWSILPSPLIFGGNVQSLTTDTTTGPFTLALLTNEEVLAVNQDALGSHAKRISQQGTTEVWARDLSAGRKAVALFNRGTQDAMISVTFSQLGVSGTLTVRDLWHRADMPDMTNGISTTVPYGGALMYTISPPGSGNGGSGGGGAGGASGGGASSGGASGNAGMPGASGSAGAAGSGVAAGGALASAGSGGSGASAAGTSASGGSQPAAGAGPANNASGSNAGGCGCRVGAADSSNARALLLSLALAALLRRRKLERARALRGFRQG